MSTIPRTIRGGRAVPFPKAAGGAGNAVHEGWIYVACGIVDGHASGTVSWFDEFDPDTRTWRRLHDAPRPRDHFSAVVSEGRLHLLGGRNTSHHEPGNFTAFFGAVIPEADVYGFGTGKWFTLPDRLIVQTAALVEGRHGVGAAVLDDGICFATGSGGRGGGPGLSSAEVFTPDR